MQWVTGIQGKWKWERERKLERKTGRGTWKNSSYSSDSLPVKFTELCKRTLLSLYYTISTGLHITVYRLMLLAICYT